MKERDVVLAKAGALINGDRQQQYGSPGENFGRIADMWSAYLGMALKPADVPAMLALVKIARLAGPHKGADNWIDLAGYAALGGEVSAPPSARLEDVDVVRVALHTSPQPPPYRRGGEPSPSVRSALDDLAAKLSGQESGPWRQTPHDRQISAED